MPIACYGVVLTTFALDGLKWYYASRIFEDDGVFDGVVVGSIWQRIQNTIALCKNIARTDYTNNAD